MLGFTAKTSIGLFLIFCLSPWATKAQWQPIFSVSSMEIHALCSEGNTVIAGGSHRKVLYSPDQGHTWRNLSLDLPTGRENIETLLANGSYLWIAVPGLGIRRSTDGGVTWDWANEGLESLRIHTLVEEEGKLLAGTDAGVFISTDGTNHWQSLHLGTAAPEVHALYTQDDKLYAGTSRGELYYSENRGKSWKILTKGILRKPIQSIVIKGEKIYLGTQGQGVYHSADEGESWITVKKGLGSAYVHELAQGDDRLLAATDAGLYFLEDGADQWKKLDGMDRGEVNATYALHAQSNHIYVGTSHQGVMRSSDSGLHWETIPKGAMQQNVQVLFDGGEQIYVGINNAIYTSLEGLHLQKALDLSGAVKHFATSGKYVFSATDAGIYRKLPNEVQWALVSSPIQVNCITSLRDEVFAGTVRDGVLKSIDGGDTWAQVGLPEENILTLVTDGEHLVAGTTQGIFRSADQGVRWHTVLENEEAVILKAYKNKLLGGTKTGLFLSSDGGKSWHRIPYDSYNYSVKNIITTPTSVIILDNAGRFFVSYDEGNTWKPYELPVLGNVSALTVYKGQMIAGTTDKGIWQHTLLPEYEGEKVVQPFSVYPNPASEKIFISLPDFQNPFIISLKDIYGRTIVQHLSSSPKYEFDILRLPEGTYYLQISGNGKKVIRRIIKQD